MAAQSTKTRRVLVVEDEDDSRHVLSVMLLMRGCEVKAFPHANGNLNEMAEFDADVALLDVRMPGRTGDELAPDLLKRCPKTRIIFLTGEAKPGLLKAAVPACLVLQKPLDFAVLLTLLDTIPASAWLRSLSLPRSATACFVERVPRQAGICIPVSPGVCACHVPSPPLA